MVFGIFWNILFFIIALSILVAIHEFGHFWVARRCGVKVERFSIGFGKALFSWRDRQDTEYVIALIPLGGYIKMLDERSEEVPPHLLSQAFNNKTVLQRAAIIAAGPFANFLLAIAAYWLVFMLGVPGIRPVTADIIPKSIAEKAQIEPGMEIKRVDGVKTPDWETLNMVLLSKIGETNTTLQLQPFDTLEHAVLDNDQLGEDDNHVTKQIDLTHWHFEPDKQRPLTALGIVLKQPTIDNVLEKVEPDSPASHAGLQTGDKIVNVDGQPFSGSEWWQLVTRIRNSPGKAIPLEVERQGTRVSLILTPALKKGQGFAGFMPRITGLSDEYRILNRHDPFTASIEATAKTWQLMKLTVNMLGKLITGDIKLNNLSGPITIAQGAGMSAGTGLIYYLMFLALISVNLGVINLCPLPVLDGGHLLFLLIEKIKGGPVSGRVQDLSYRIGSFLLMLLMGLALFNDFSRFS